MSKNREDCRKSTQVFTNTSNTSNTQIRGFEISKIVLVRRWLFTSLVRCAKNEKIGAHQEFRTLNTRINQWVGRIPEIYFSDVFLVLHK